MKPNHPQICLYQPQIPQNTGSIGRLAAATACRLHLVEPFGFSTSDKNLRRPGLDYWPFLDLEIHQDLAAAKRAAQGSTVYLTKFANKPYTEICATTSLLVFGAETTGLPDDVLKENSDQSYQLPMFHSGVRSLNLSNAVAIVVYDQLRKRGLFS